MNHFDYQDGALNCEQVSLDDLAQSVGTPFYVYSSATSDASGSYFQPASLATGTNKHTCSGQWSGNFLNWATMQTIDAASAAEMNLLSRRAAVESRAAAYPAVCSLACMPALKRAGYAGSMRSSSLRRQGGSERTVMRQPCP